MRLSIILSALILFFSNCSNKDKNSFSHEGMHNLNLSKYGKPFSVFVPDTISAKLSIEEIVNGALEIKVGKTFAISINEQAADIELKKQDIKDDEVNKFKLYIMDTPDGIIWQSQITDPEFHFLLNQKIGNTDYCFQDISVTDSKPFAKELIQKMFDACKNVSENK